MRYPWPIAGPVFHSQLFHRLKKWRDRKREEEDDMQFPDEVDTPMDVRARLRFQRYRGLRSFRTSPWDPYENLPRDYARIFQFEDFKRTERAVKRRAEEDTAAVQVCRGISPSRVTARLTTLKIAGHSCDSLPEGCPCRGFASPAPPLCDLLASAARAQEVRPQLYLAAQYGVRRFRPVKGAHVCV